MYLQLTNTTSSKPQRCDQPPKRNAAESKHLLKFHVWTEHFNVPPIQKKCLTKAALLCTSFPTLFPERLQWEAGCCAAYPRLIAGTFFPPQHFCLFISEIPPLCPTRHIWESQEQISFLSTPIRREVTAKICLRMESFPMDLFSLMRKPQKMMPTPSVTNIFV